MHHEKCPYCGEAGYSLGSWDCGTRFAMGDEEERRSVRCCLRELSRIEVERNRLRDGLTVAMEWLDEVCDPDCDDWTPEGLKVHAKLTTILSTTQSIEETKS